MGTEVSNEVVLSPSMYEIYQRLDGPVSLGNILRAEPTARTAELLARLYFYAPTGDENPQLFVKSDGKLELTDPEKALRIVFAGAPPNHIQSAVALLKRDQRLRRAIGRDAWTVDCEPIHPLIEAKLAALNNKTVRPRK